MAGSGKRGQSWNVWAEMWRTLRLAWRLLRDPRVSPFVKILVPGLAFIYVLLPVDISPDLVPLLGQIDDLAALILAARLLVEMSPPAVVAEHEAEMMGLISRQSSEPPPDDVVDADYRILD
ncbi:MAG: DUF1232 domain-containing protein [Chloroflexi bacterium]|nr:DUF1232 domain-containing protein [Chloroflexota bacterium]